MEPYDILKYPISTEKGIKLMESENKLLFVVDLKSSKPQIKKAAEKMFNVGVESVTTSIIQGKKRAYIKIAKETPAINIATQLGLI